MTAGDLVDNTASSIDKRSIAPSPDFVDIHFGHADQRRKSAFTFWVVPTTHEDLSWYITAARTALRVAEHKDGIVRVLNEEPNSCFTFEQAGAVEEYLEYLRPEKRELVEELFMDRRLELIGVQIQPDVFLGSGEAFFWNIQSGRATCKRLGAVPSKALYIPDTFGFPSSMPKMLKAAGIDNLIFTRGLGDEAKELGAVFNWAGDDGSHILAFPIPDGYGNGNKLGRWIVENGECKDLSDSPELWVQAATLRIKELISSFGERYRSIGLSDILLCNGSDFEEIDTQIQKILAGCQVELQQDMPGIAFRFAALEDYLDVVKKSLDAVNLKTFHGELRGALEHPILRGVESTRIPLKQALEEAERVIYVADVLTALSVLKAKYDPTMTIQHDLSLLMNSLDLVKETILPVYSHDAICGCGTDEVYYDMHQRIRNAQEIADQVRRNSLANLAGTRDIYSYRPRIGERVSVVNTLPYSVRGVAEIPVPSSLSDSRGLKAESQGEEIPVQILKGLGKKVAAVVVDVEGFGATEIHLKKDNRPAGRQKSRPEKNCRIENEFYWVDVLPDGTIKVTDKQTGDTAYGLLFEDQADRGDEYTFCPLEGSSPITTERTKAKVKVLSQGPVLSELQINLKVSIPKRLTEDRKQRTRKTVSLPITTTIRLVQGMDRVDFKTTVENTAEDHRLRVLFKTPGFSDTVLASEPFTVEERSAVGPPEGKDWCEQPQATSHNQGMVAAGGLVLFNRGLPEYEAATNSDGKSNTLALTLLRCIGWLSRGDLSTRRGHAGPYLKTPDAQCLGAHTFEYAISMRRQSDKAELLRKASEYRIGLEIGPGGVDFGSALQVGGEGWEISALKPCKDGTGAILRLYNPLESQAPINISGRPTSAQRYLADDETPIDDHDCRSTTLRGGEIVTLKLS